MKSNGKLMLIPAAGYIRMSQPSQDDSPAQQRSEIIKLAKRLGYKIIVWYQDDRGTVAGNGKRSAMWDVAIG